MDLDNKTKSELRILIRDVVREVLFERKSSKKTISSKHYSQKVNDVESLIGSIPFILFDKKIFQKTVDVIEFAEKIGILIPKGGNRKIDEIIGRIITAIKEFPPHRIALLNQTISHLKASSPVKKDKASFFEEWDRVIKNMKL